MTNISEIDSLKSENQKLRSYVSLVLAELELTQRVCEIKENFANSADSERLIIPIMIEYHEFNLKNSP